MTEREEIKKAQAHDHTSSTNEGCMFCISVEGLESWNHKYEGLPLAERRILALKRD
jgi:hypothetical protein